MFKQTGEITESFRRLDRLRELDRAVHEISRQDPFESVEDVALPDTLADIDPIALPAAAEPNTSHGLLGKVVMQNEDLQGTEVVSDDDSIASTIPGELPNLEQLQEQFSFLGQIILDESIVNLGMNYSDPVPYAEYIASALSEDQLLELITPQKRQQYLTKILTHKFYGDFAKEASERFEALLQKMTSLNVTEKDDFLERIVKRHIEYIREIIRLTNHNYFSLIASDRSLPIKNLTEYFEYLNSLVERNKSTSIRKFLCGQSELLEILKVINIDYLFMHALYEAIDERIIAVINDLQTKVEIETAAQLLIPGAIHKRFDHFAIHKNISSMKFHQIFMHFFPEADLSAAGFKLGQESVASIPEPNNIDEFKAVMTNSDYKRGYLNRELTTLKLNLPSYLVADIKTAKYTALSLLLKYYGLSGEVNDHVTYWNKALNFLDALACKLIEQDKKLMTLTGMADTQLLQQLCALFDNACLCTIKEKPSSAYFMVVLTKLLEMLRHQELLFESIDAFDRSNMLQARRYIRKLRHEVNDRQRQIYALENCVFKSHSNKNYLFWFTHSKGTTKEEAIQLIETLEQKNHRLKLKLDRLQQASENKANRASL